MTDFMTEFAKGYQIGQAKLDQERQMREEQMRQEAHAISMEERQQQKQVLQEKLRQMKMQEKQEELQTRKMQLEQAMMPIPGERPTTPMVGPMAQGYGTEAQPVQVPQPQQMTEIMAGGGLPTQQIPQQYQGDIDRRNQQLAIEAINREVQKQIAIDTGKSANDSFTLGPGEVRYGPNKKIVAVGPPRQKNGSDGGLTDVQGFDREFKIGEAFEKHTKESKTAQRQVEIINASYESLSKAMKEGQGIGAQSQAIVTGFNKMLDPISTVRESEYARTPEGQALLRQIEGKFQQMAYGGVGMTKEGLREIKDLTVTLLSGYKAQQLEFAQKTKAQADLLKKLSNGKFGDMSRIVTPEVLASLEAAGLGGGGAAADMFNKSATGGAKPAIKILKLEQVK